MVALGDSVGGSWVMARQVVCRRKRAGSSLRKYRYCTFLTWHRQDRFKLRQEVLHRPGLTVHVHSRHPEGTNICLDNGKGTQVQ